MKTTITLLILLALVSCNKKSKPAAEINEIAAIEKKLQKSPSYENYVAYGMLLGKDKQSALAVQAYQKATQINPQAPVAWNNICFEQINLNQPLRAAENCQKALQLEPSFQLAKNNLALAQQKVAEAREVAEKNKANLINNPERSSEKVVDLGMSFYSLNEFQKAIEVWNLINSDDSFYAIAQNNIASSNIILGHLGKAEQALNAALQIEPNNSLFLNNKKWLEDEKNKQNN